jgi:hypothetical protein
LKNVIAENESSKLPEPSPLFNSTFAVELKAKHPAGDNPYEEKWAFFNEMFDQSFNKGGANDV